MALTLMDMPGTIAPATPRAVLGRRGLIARGLAGWCAGRMPSIAASVSGSSVLAALCARWRCPSAIAWACLDVLPVGEASKEALIRCILADPGGDEAMTTRTLARAIRARSRDDFRDGRIVTVDGWMLSLTEARVYALTALS